MLCQNEQIAYTFSLTPLPRRRSQRESERARERERERMRQRYIYREREREIDRVREGGRERALGLTAWTQTRLVGDSDGEKSRSQVTCSTALAQDRGGGNGA